ncbi:hypothetical protein Zmor_003682 [Zophobas morio]|uniref:Uncharacterized protein n=1 Tax=Zophobas morio TaxID=2755281 RepID=A0AA38HMG3_9CUCU|nr:hypothetical protein Zmor_003682 [Zophobas morio]
MGTKSPNFPVLSINIIFKASDRFPWLHTVTLPSRNNRQSAFYALIWRTSSCPIKSLQLQLICTFASETWGQYKRLRSRPISLTNALSFWVVRRQLIMGNALLQTLVAVSDEIGRNRFFCYIVFNILTLENPIKTSGLELKVNSIPVQSRVRMGLLPSLIVIPNFRPLC